jgi:signal transduction histidine kinase
MHQTLKLLKRNYPAVEKDTQIVSTIEDSIARIKALMAQARQQVGAFKKARDQVIQMAATGLLVEVLAHELNRATRHALSSLSDFRTRRLDPSALALFSTLESQLKTLQKRLRILDPLAAAGRQVKDTFDLVEWVKTILDSHTEQFRRHGIHVDLKVLPRPRQGGLQVKMVKGMLVQILENLLSNSAYWLIQQRRLEASFKPQIVIQIDTEAVTVSVTDNGPGVDPQRREEIFQPYVTTKPAGEGKGLGLFISREIAKYHKASLMMGKEASVHPDLEIASYLYVPQG